MAIIEDIEPGGIDVERLGTGRKRRSNDKPRLSAAQREEGWGFVFISPWIIGLVVFTGIPIVASFVLSFTSYDLLRPENTQFVFLGNYLWAVSDTDTIKSVFVTLKYAAVTVPMTLGLSLAIAMLVNHKLLAGRRVFTTLFFMPAQIPIVASVVIWVGFYSGTSGVPLSWLQSTSTTISEALSQIPVVGAPLASNWPTGSTRPLAWMGPHPGLPSGTSPCRCSHQ